MLALTSTSDRGQGLNNAILDATGFVKAVSGHSSPATAKEAISHYDAEVQKRGREEVLSSYKNTQMLLDWDAFKKSPLFTNGLGRERSN